MADEESPVVSAQPAKSKKMGTILVVLAVMLAEGGLIFGAMKMFGAGASSSVAQQVDEKNQAAKPKPGELASEVLIVETEAYNNLSGRMYLYHIQVQVQVALENKEIVEKIAAEREATIKDRINTVIRSADPKQLNEPRLETLRRQVKFELDKITGDESLVQEVLIPKLLQSRSSL